MGKDDPTPRYAEPPPSYSKGKTHQVPYHIHAEGLPRLSIRTGSEDYPLDVSDDDSLTDGGTVGCARIRHYVDTGDSGVGDGTIEGLYVLQKLILHGNTATLEGGAIHGEVIVGNDYALGIDPVYAGIYGEATWQGSSHTSPGDFAAVAGRISSTDGDGTGIISTFYVATPTVAVGNLLKTYGLFIDDQVTGNNATTKYGIAVKNGICEFNTGKHADADFIINTDTQAILKADAGSEYVRIGDTTTNYSQFASDGELTLAGTAKVTRTIPVDLTIGGGTATIEAFQGAPSINLDADQETWYFSFEAPNDWDAASDLTLVFMVANEIGETDGRVVSITCIARGYADGEKMSALGQSISASLVLTGGDEAINTVNRVIGLIDYNNAAYPIAAGDTVVVKAMINLGGGGECTGPLHVIAQWVEYTANKLGSST